jgi:hypothetical protein
MSSEQQTPLELSAPPVGVVIVNDRVSIHTQGVRRVVLAHGVIVAHYEISDHAAEAYAETLRVSTFLEGSVRKGGNRIRVTAQLITAADGSHVWSERYDRDMTDLFAIQDEISRAIAEKLGVHLAAGKSLVKRHTENVEAYQLFLTGPQCMTRILGEG